MPLQRTTQLSIAIAVLLSGQVQAAPDAGQTLQQLQQKQPTIPKTDQFTITAPSLAIDTPAGGEQIEVKTIILSGNKVFKAEQLSTTVLAEVTGKTYDLATIKGLAVKISEYYRAQGYPFARAFIPAQTIENGVLNITIVEGQYGKISAVGTNETLNQQVQVFLSNLHTGDIIESSSLERATLILSDQAGIKSSPVIQPGKETGTGDLLINLAQDKRFTGNVGIDNHGNYYTGQHKAKANLNINSPLMLGDQITLSGIYSEEQMWFGNLGYNLPIYGSGLRANMSYAHTYYQLGKDFKNLEAKGTAAVATLGMSYPLIRSQKTNLNVSASLQHKTLQDDPSNTVATNTKYSSSLPVSLSFDTRDSLWNGGISFGSLGWTGGRLTLNDYLQSNDTNKTAGDFNKYTIDITRIQTLTEGLSLLIKGSGQASDKNLDSSEGFGIGGITGVRAYPTGEGYGNLGWVAQSELRYAVSSSFVPYAFYDVGHSQANHTVSSGVNNPVRDLSGAGIGVRYNQNQWSADMSSAWQLSGGKPEDKNLNDAEPRVWFSVNYAFEQ